MAKITCRDAYRYVMLGADVKSGHALVPQSECLRKREFGGVGLRVCAGGGGHLGSRGDGVASLFRDSDCDSHLIGALTSIYIANSPAE